MSCYMIYYVDGAKQMRPIRTAAEYRDLRNSARQQAIVAKVRQGEVKQKHRLLQMNYSCLPGADGRLKGSKSPSMSVGMDVDFDPSDPAYEQRMAAVPQLVLAKREELGLLMLERSARKGYHVVFRRRFTEGLAEGKVLEFYSCNSEEAYVKRASYIPYPSIDEEDGIDISERCYTAVVYTTAALVLTAYGASEQAAAMNTLAKSIFE